jgi:hypothetical protein
MRDLRRMKTAGCAQRCFRLLLIVDYSRIFAVRAMTSLQTKRNFSQLQAFNSRN